ncbi:MAG: M4 family metallopeptidase [Bacteroidia bacterium]|nr:M4 family metallopeptidase [Bacteroidia bacterium]
MQPKITIFLIFFSWMSLKAQNNPNEMESQEVPVCEGCTQHRWWFPENSFHEKEIDALLQEIKFLSKPELKLIQRQEESAGQAHLIYQQTYQEIPVFGAQLKFHLKEGFYHAIQGRYIPVHALPSSNIRILSKAQIISKAIERLEGAHFAWENPDWEASIKESTGTLDASYYSKPQLHYYPKNNLYSTFILAYKVEIRTIEPDDLYTLWIDASTGDVLSVNSKSSFCQSKNSSFESLYYGQRNMDVRSRSWPNKDLVLESCEPWELSTRFYETNSFGEGRSWRSLDKITHNDESWGTHHQLATTAHWCLIQAMNYFSNASGWTGPAGRGEETRLLVNWKDANGLTIENARYLKDKDAHYIYLGEIAGNSLATLDIVGHEYAHAFIEEYVGLEQERESGALAEGLADIFGFLIEKSVLGDNGDWDWTIGEDAFPVRSLKDPQEYLMPKFASEQDPFWFPNDPQNCPTPTSGLPPFGNDYCGIHQNSSVIGHWFYLLTQGGKQNQIEVRPIGIESGEQILLRMVRFYLLSASDFSDARQASMIAAEDIFGSCSQELAQIQNAWAAVGVGRPNSAECISILGSTEICTDEPSRQYLFEAVGPNEAQYEWLGIPKNWFYRVQGNNGQFLSLEGLPETIEEIELILIANWNGKSDTLSLLLSPSDCSQKAPRQPDPIPNFEDIRIYPNPAAAKVNLYLPDGLFPAEIEIYDAAGKLVLKQNANASISAYSLASLHRGVYMVKVSTHDIYWQGKLLVL